MDQLKVLAQSNVYVGTVVVVVSLILLAIKVIPLVVNVFQKARTTVNDYEQLHKDMEGVKCSIECIEKRMADNDIITNKVQEVLDNQQKIGEDSLEEREIILKSLLGVIQGLQEMGANGPTKKVEKDIQTFLIEKSHKVRKGKEGI